MPTNDLRRASRPLARLLVLLIVPWVWLASTPQLASAAAAAEVPTASASFHAGNTFGNTDCGVTGYFKQTIDLQMVQEVTVRLKGTCSTSMNISSSLLTMTVKGEGCAWTVDVGEVDGFPTLDEVATPDTFPPYPPTCVVTELCWTSEQVAHSNPWGEDTYTGCEPFTLGAPPSPPQAEQPTTTNCEHFDPLRVRVWKTEGGAHPLWSGYGSATGGYSRLHVKVTGTRKIGAAGLGIAITPTLSGSGTVNTYERYVYPDSNSGAVRALTNGFEMWEGVGAANYFAEPTDANTTVQIMSLPYFLSSRADQQNLAAKRRLSSWATSGAATRWQNDPPNCMWTFGKKRAADNPNSTLDDPAGSLTLAAGVDGDDQGPAAPPPDPEVTPPTPVADTACDSFSWTDPATWAGAGICQLVKLAFAVLDTIQSIWGWLGDLGGFLTGLFVPSDSALDGFTDSMSSAVDESNAGDWRAAAEDGFTDALPGGAPVSGRVLPATDGGMSLGGAGNCQGPGFSWDKLGTVGLPTSVHPIAACDGIMAELAEWSRLLLTITIGCLGGLKILNMLFVSLGLMKQTNILLASDWGNDHVSIKR